MNEICINKIMKEVLIIIGPTASGKSSAAIEYASKLNGVIINADRIQLYSDLSILSANPNKFESQTIDHKLYEILDWTENLSVIEWINLVKGQIEQTHKMQKLPILVGGSAMYIHSLLYGIHTIPKTNQETTDKFSKMDTASLYNELTIIDPQNAKIIHPHHRSRIIRAIEIKKLTGKSALEYYQQQKTLFVDSFLKTVVMIQKPISQLKLNIKKRIDGMIQEGAIEQVEKFLKKCNNSLKNAQYSSQYNSQHTSQHNSQLNLQKHMIFNTIGFEEVAGYLNNEFSIEKMKEKIFLKTCKYMKHQNTWFRNKFTPDFTVYN